MLQTTAAEQLHRSTEHCYRACYDTTSVPCSEKALLQSMLHSSTRMDFRCQKALLQSVLHSFTGDLQSSHLREARRKRSTGASLSLGP